MIERELASRQNRPESRVDQELRKGTKGAGAKGAGAKGAGAKTLT